MDLVHLHLLLNHFPIVGTFLTLGLLLVGILKKNHSLITTSAYLMLVLALLTIPAFYTGEPAEEVIEHLPGISHNFIHQHEESAELAFLVMLLSGAVALGYILLQRLEAPIAKYIPMVLLAATVLTAIFMARAGNEGGKIRHSELQTSQQTNGMLDSEEAEDYENHEHN